MRLATSAAALALAGSLALTGCTSSESGSGPAAPSPSAAAAAGSFASTAEILAALNAKGLSCAEPMTGSFPGVTEAQGCILNGAEDVVLLRFATPAEKQEYVANKEALASAVVGEDWAVQTVLPETAEQVAAALGGEVLPGEQPAG